MSSKPLKIPKVIYLHDKK